MGCAMTNRDFLDHSYTENMLVPMFICLNNVTVQILGLCTAIKLGF
jgi:hypothetical protein